jgi:hypothetical protein
MTKKIVSETPKKPDRSTSMRFAPITWEQIENLKEKLGESANRVIVRAIDHLHREFFEQKKTTKESKK